MKRGMEVCMVFLKVRHLSELSKGQVTQLLGVYNIENAFKIQESTNTVVRNEAQNELNKC